MKRVYLVVYDICEPKRLRRVFETCKSFGDHLQYSVFRAVLSPRGRVELQAALEPLLHHAEDQVLIIDLGRDAPRAHDRFQSIGRPYRPPPPPVTIV